MDTLNISVANVKCQGCVANIKNGLSHMAEIESVTVDVATGAVEVQGNGLNREQIAVKLTELGYPENDA